MKIVSLNLWNGGRLFDAAMSFLKGQNADIYLLQECYDGHNPDLAARFRTVELLKANFPDYEVRFAGFYLDCRSVEGEIEDGQVIMSRWPLSYAQMIWFDVPYGRYDNDAMTDFSELSAGMLKAEFAYGDKQITLLNVHGPWHLAGDDDTPRRQVMVRSILDNLGEHTVLAGDFNAQPSVASMKKLALRLINLFDGDLTTSFNVKRKDLAKFPGYATAVVDMAFTTPNWRLLAKQVPQVDVSDHLPLVFEIEPI